MTLLKKNELKAMNIEQISEKLRDLKKELLKLNAQRAVRTTIESPGRIKLIKRTIARLLTLLKSKSNINGQKPKANSQQLKTKEEKKK